MKIVIVTPDGELYNETVTSVVVASDNNGFYGMLENHLPIVSTIDTGYLKLENGTSKVYVVVTNAVVENHQNQITVIAQDAYVGTTDDEAFENLSKVRAARIEENKTRNVELTLAEQELKKQIKKTGAGKL